jgi:dihydropteroate synthase
VTTDLVTASGVLPTATRPVVMGILNVTPDSFSDGGRAFDPSDHPGRAIAAGRALVAAGADLVDVGGESTRPGADPVGIDEELRRVVPVVAGLVAHGVMVSVDTRHAAVAAEAVAAGAAIVNDVAAVDPDPGMLEVIAATGVAYIAMHLQGEPRTMQDAPTYRDVVSEVEQALLATVARAVAAGVGRERLAVDPGIGFGKTFAHNLALLRALPRLCAHGLPVLIGTSRKSFLGRITGVERAEDRLVGSVVSAVLAARAGARILRVHDVAATVEALAVLDALAPVGDDDDPRSGGSAGSPRASGRETT